MDIFLSMPDIPISGTVILYNPDRYVLENIASYIDYIDVLYAVDNSDDPDLCVLSNIKNMAKVKYLPLGKNFGIGKALNVAAVSAIDEGYRWLLTMDQDSCVTDNIIIKMLQCLNCYNENEVGIICSRYTDKNLYVEKIGQKYNELLIAITSGNLLNLKNYQKVGHFMEKLFIDHVDHEYCLRLRKNKYKIIQVNDAFIQHKLGHEGNHLIGRSSHHDSFRRYFMTRNRFYVAFLYKNEFPEFCRNEIIGFIGELIKIIVYEKDKLKKLKNIVMGYLDYKKNKFNRDLKEL